MRMKKIDMPNITQVEVCDSFKNMRYRQRILDNSEHYMDYLNNLQPLLDDEQAMKRADEEYAEYMKKLYTGQFAHKGCQAYKFYKIIRNSQHTCAYCNFYVRSVSQLDHYLPKSVFPSLAISPVNLIPICSDCNFNKREYYSVKKDEMIIHPYFDDLAKQSFDFIKCTVIETFPIGFSFSINKLQNWSDCTYNRVVKHFQMLELKDLYRTDFEATFESYVYELKSIYQDGNIDDVKKAIERRMNSYLQIKSSPWLYAGFYSILNSEWFFQNFLHNLIKSNDKSHVST